MSYDRYVGRVIEQMRKKDEGHSRVSARLKPPSGTKKGTPISRAGILAMIKAKKFPEYIKIAYNEFQTGHRGCYKCNKQVGKYKVRGVKMKGYGLYSTNFTLTTRKRYRPSGQVIIEPDGKRTVQGLRPSSRGRNRGGYSTIHCRMTAAKQGGIWTLGSAIRRLYRRYRKKAPKLLIEYTSKPRRDSYNWKRQSKLMAKLNAYTYGSGGGTHPYGWLYGGGLNAFLGSVPAVANTQPTDREWLHSGGLNNFLSGGQLDRFVGELPPVANTGQGQSGDWLYAPGPIGGIRAFLGGQADYTGPVGDPLFAYGEGDSFGRAGSSLAGVVQTARYRGPQGELSPYVYGGYTNVANIGITGSVF